MAPPQRISLNPDPPTQGQQVTICYDFTGSGIGATTLEVTFDAGSPASHDVTVDAPCVTITVPRTATELTVIDSDGPSPDKWSPVEPA